MKTVVELVPRAHLITHVTVRLDQNPIFFNHLSHQGRRNKIGPLQSNANVLNVTKAGELCQNLTERVVIQ
jgi:hypothetical protein